MAKYTGPVCRLCRREGTKLYLKGDRCYSESCAMNKRAFAPGQHGQGRKKVSEYGLQLREKQKARRIYGVLEKQFRNYFEKAERQPGVTGENLMRLLERRLDNTIFRLGLSKSRNEARQLIRHGHFQVNGRKVNIPSFLVNVNDEITVSEKSKKSPKMTTLLEFAAQKTVPGWLDLDKNTLVGKVVSLPTEEHIDVPIEEHLIVELYSR